ncbi:MAG: phosphopantetheine-binding protein [Syntrophobacteraceae bacterium]|nr:phosphopantetheine-binding protein [Syntrophobacteraceae bacterium]
MRELFADIQQAFHGALDVDPQKVSMDTVPDDIPGWDSVGHLSLVASLESVFKVSFDVDELMEMENVREIVRLIHAKTKRT